MKNYNPPKKFMPRLSYTLGYVQGRIEGWLKNRKRSRK